MTRHSKRDEEAEARVQRAEKAAEVVREQGERIGRQLGLVGKLKRGWDRVHEYNHLAHLFHERS